MNRQTLSSIDDSPPTPYYKIILLGQTCSGKTKLLTRLIFDSYDDKGITTLGVDYSNVQRKDAKYGYYDTAGQETYRSMLSLYFKGANAAILIYSVDSLQSLEELNFYYKKVIDQQPDCSIYLIGCKSDLPWQVSKEIVCKKFKGIKHYITSAKKNEGVKQAFHQIQKDLLMKPTKKKQTSNMIRLSTKSAIKNKQKQKCC